METNILDLPEKEYMLPGNRACAGCGLAIAYRYILKALDSNVIFAVPASCLTVLQGMYPSSSVNVPCINVAFPSTAASACGVAAGLKALGNTDITVVAFAGDGGTYDIGIQGLSGAAERSTDMIYICYDNEAYMNTGNQRSGSTPLGATTATTPILNKQQHAKDIPQIMEAHNVPYIATACASYPADLYDKVRKARDKKGVLRYLHILAPCPPGWGFPTKETVKIGRLCVETGMFVLYENEDRTFRLTGKSAKMAQDGSKLKPMAECVGAQGRFSNATEDQLNKLQQWVNFGWEQCLRQNLVNQGEVLEKHQVP